MLPVERVVEDGEYPGQEVWIEVAEIVPDVLQDCKHYVQTEIEMLTLVEILLEVLQDCEHYYVS